MFSFFGHIEGAGVGVERFSLIAEVIGIDTIWLTVRIFVGQVRDFCFTKHLGRDQRPFAVGPCFVERYLQILGPNNEWFFPCPPWEKVGVEIKDGTGWHQKKCPHVDFFRSEGVFELTRAYCDMDKRIAELLPEQIELRRDNNMCEGDGWCDFLYYRK